MSDVDGDCSWVIPNTEAPQGTRPAANRNRRFWIQQIGPPAPGTFTNPSLVTGRRRLRGLAVPLPDRHAAPGDGITYSSTANFMIGTGNTNPLASGGIWQNSRINPTAPTKCGLNVALILDLSDSVGR